MPGTLKILFHCSAFLACALFVGCASVVNGDSQTIQFATRNAKGDAIEGAKCDWKNSKNTGSFTTPGVVNVRRDYDTLHVTCRLEGSAQGTVAVTSKASSAMAGNILAGGIVGALVDHSSGNAYEYPSVIVVRLGSDAAISDPKRATGQRQSVAIHRDLTAIPAPSGFASVSDVAAAPAKGQACRDLYTRYLGLANPKAIAFSTGGACASRTGVDAISAALDGCSARGNGRCDLYAVDNNVVWKK